MGFYHLLTQTVVAPEALDRRAVTEVILAASVVAAALLMVLQGQLMRLAFEIRERGADALFAPVWPLPFMRRRFSLQIVITLATFSVLQGVILSVIVAFLCLYWLTGSSTTFSYLVIVWAFAGVVAVLIVCATVMTMLSLGAVTASTMRPQAPPPRLLRLHDRDAGGRNTPAADSEEPDDGSDTDEEAPQPD